jgi:CheY-like chemotaxis protein
VRHNGEGIAREMLPRVFELFAQGDSGLERAKGGLGLGLTIARQIVELHGGAIEARSEGPGRGSEFVVILPRTRRPGEGADAGESPSLVPAGPLRVMVVDDNVDSATSLKLLLDLEGYETSIAHDGMTALEMIAARRPDVLLLDIGLPRLNGYDVARELRLDPGNAGIHIIAVTGYAQEADRRKAREVGIDDHLVKPVDTDALLARLVSISRARADQATPLSSPGITREK